MRYDDFEDAVIGEQEKLIRWLTRQLEDRHAAEDVAQQTFCQLWRNRRTVQEWTTNLVFSAARNRMVDYLRTVHDVVPLEDVHHQVSVELDMVDHIASLQPILDKIPKAYRTVMLLYAEGLDYPVIAEELKIPLGTVKSRLNWGRRRARELRDKMAG